MALTPLKRQLRRSMLATALLLLGASALAQMPAPDTIAPNEHLTAEGIPPIPADLAAKVALYNDFRSRVMLDWHPTKREMLISTRTKGVATQLHLLRKPKGELEQLTDFPDPVRIASFEPNLGQYLVFEKDEGGSEASQLFRLDLDSGKITQLTDPKEKARHGPMDACRWTVVAGVNPTRQNRQRCLARRSDHRAVAAGPAET
ncbi:TolB family protein [Undibacterium arcticum]